MLILQVMLDLKCKVEMMRIMRRRLRAGLDEAG